MILEFKLQYGLWSSNCPNSLHSFRSIEQGNVGGGSVFAQIVFKTD